MENKYFKKINCIYIIIIMLILIMDISSKNWIMNHIEVYDIKEIFSILNFFHIHNYGIAFSLLSDPEKPQKWLLSIISSFVILAIINIIIKSEKTEKSKIIGYCLIIAGALGNLIDRIFYGFVIDFIDIHFYDWHFATFNIADSSIFFWCTYTYMETL